MRTGILKGILGIIITANIINVSNTIQVNNTEYLNTNKTAGVQEIKEVNKDQDKLLKDILPTSEVERFKEVEIVLLEDGKQLEKEYEEYGFEGIEENLYNGFYSYWDMLLVVEIDGLEEHTFKHEVGHFIDMTENKEGNKLVFKYSNSKEFKEIYEKEKNKLFNDDEAYYRDDITEYFAEAYAMFVDNYDYKDIAPLTYDYIQNVKAEII